MEMYREQAKESRKMQYGDGVTFPLQISTLRMLDSSESYWGLEFLCMFAATLLIFSCLFASASNCIFCGTTAGST